ncbi:hypothetical protein EZV76_02070 [Flagellimonas alvinocaridis]|uniref:DM13 domain-containing protein n=2 Tax=Flagellimonas alvinocaridis TaxID=2530200 RepID=A0A4V4HXI0_9FLAO|nr:hypothetical protein EZV76_02070 [Allomuricauda alvinocaridis]
MSFMDFKLTSFCVILALPFLSCIGEDYVDDFVEPTIRINNPITGIQISDSHPYSATYLNNIGQPEDVKVTWSTSNASIVTIDDQGVATAIAEGEATISATILIDGSTLTAEDSITISSDPVENSEESNGDGTIATTSAYALEGTFTLRADKGNLNLSFNSDYKASSSLPGLYLYLSNNPNSVNGALEVGAVTVFEGAHTYIIEDVGLNEYQYLLYWCKPFNVKVGEGLIN